MARKIYTIKEEGLKIELFGDEKGDQEFYVDGVHGIQQTGLGVKMNFFSLGIDTTAEYQRRETVCRLAMAQPQFLQMVDFLQGIAQNMRANAIAAAAPASDDNQ